jgi:hypothetical protein
MDTDLNRKERKAGQFCGQKEAVTHKKMKQGTW